MTASRPRSTRRARPQATGTSASRAAIGRALYLTSVFPERRKLFGRVQRAAPPAGRLRDGSSLWFY